MSTLSGALLSGVQPLYGVPPAINTTTTTLENLGIILIILLIWNSLSNNAEPLDELEDEVYLPKTIVDVAMGKNDKMSDEAGKNGVAEAKMLKKGELLKLSVILWNMILHLIRTILTSFWRGRSLRTGRSFSMMTSLRAGRSLRTMSSFRTERSLRMARSLSMERFFSTMTSLRMERSLSTMTSLRTGRSLSTMMSLRPQRTWQQRAAEQQGDGWWVWAERRGRGQTKTSSSSPMLERAVFRRPNDHFFLISDAGKDGVAAAK